MRIGIIGAGISGLTAAHLLCRQPGYEVVLYERAGVPGGRASLVDSGEHCPRVFLDDYHELFGVLRQVRRPGGGTLRDAVVPLDRFYYTSRAEWVRISRLFGFQARELRLRDRAGLSRIGWSSAVLAEYPAAVNTNRYSPGSNWSAWTLARAAWKVVQPRSALALRGPTDACLTDPWLADLAGRGVDARLGCAVTAVETLAGAGLRVHSASGQEDFGAVIVAAFAGDARELLDASGIPHRLTGLEHTHLKVLTAALDPRERVTRLPRPALYHSGGVGLLVQPAAARCIAVAIRGPSNDDGYLLGRVRRDLQLEHPVARVCVRSNQRPEEGLYTADYVDPARILAAPVPGLYFAGSYLRNSYPVDSGEGACRTALSAVAALRRDLMPGRRRAA